MIILVGGKLFLVGTLPATKAPSQVFQAGVFESGVFA